MADITPVRSQAIARVELVTWETLTNSDTAGTSIAPPGLLPLGMAFQVIGTFDSATVVLQGSNDNTNWVTVKDIGGSDVSFTAAGGADISSAYAYYRPSTSGGGASQDLDVLLTMRGA